MKIAGWKNVIWIAIAILVLGVFWTNQCEAKTVEPEEQTVETVWDVKRGIISIYNDALKDPNHRVRKQVEKAHLTVDVKNAYVLKCEIDTFDGSTNAGRNLDNISLIKLTIHTVWDGIFQKNGTTDVQVVISSPAGESVSVSTRILQSNSRVNREDPGFWKEVGKTALKIGAVVGLIASEYYADGGAESAE